MTRLRCIVAFALLSFAAFAAFAQDDPHAGCAAPPTYVPAALLERPVPLRAGVGNSHEKVTTASAEAQQFYDQGLNHLESYVFIEAARSFRQALRHDPKLAMAWIGLSRTYSGLDNPEAARQFFEKAKALAENVSDGERRRIEIREKQLAAMEDIEDAAKFAAYKKSIDDALAAHVDDPALWLLRGNAEEPTAAGRGQRGTVASVAFYERVLELVPDHASAHHFLVHTYEGLNRMNEALAHGEQYARLAPAIPHAAHMWGHDLRRVGRVDDAIAEFRKAEALERAYYDAEKIDASLDWHHGHNLDLLASCYEHKGQLELAEKTLREADRLEPMDAQRAFSRREIPAFLIRRGRYAEALEAARKLAASEFAQARAAGHALAGNALLAMKKIDDARAELALARRDLELVPLVTPGILPRRSMVAPWVEALEGEILLRTGKTAEGREILKRVEKAMRMIPGPDAWTQTLFRLESIARTAREVGDWELAAFTAEQMLDHDPAYGGSHAAMSFVLRQKGDGLGAVRELESARRCWRDADGELPDLMVLTAGLVSD